MTTISIHLSDGPLQVRCTPEERRILEEGLRGPVSTRAREVLTAALRRDPTRERLRAALGEPLSSQVRAYLLDVVGAGRDWTAMVERGREALHE